MRVVLLAPPGRRNYVRDNYCSKVAKADYAYEPLDLLLLSGRFDDARFIDAVKAGLSPQDCLTRVIAARPQAVISLVGAVSWPEDRDFLAALKAARPEIKILVSGDVVLEAGAEFMDRHPWLDAIILDFTNADAARFLAGNYSGIEQMLYRDGEGRVTVKRSPRERGEITDLPQPRHELFEGLDYAYPFVRRARFATVQTDYGCPFKCRFCVMASLGYRTRPVAEVIEELAGLKERGVREIYFNDQTLGGAGPRLEELCRAMIEAGLDLGWCCWNRVDTVEGRLELMKRAGCHTIMFGVETANDETLKRNRKGFDVAQVRETFARCRELGIRTLATYLIGLPGEDEADIERTIELALELKSDFASFNVLVPRHGTEVRREMAAQGAILDEALPLDQTGAQVNVSLGLLTPERIKTLRDKAVRRFYLRPGYILRRLAGIRTPYDVKVLIRMASTMIWS